MENWNVFISNLAEIKGTITYCTKTIAMVQDNKSSLGTFDIKTKSLSNSSIEIIDMFKRCDICILFFNMLHMKKKLEPERPCTYKLKRYDDNKHTQVERENDDGVGTQVEDAFLVYTYTCFFSIVSLYV